MLVAACGNHHSPDGVTQISPSSSVSSVPMQVVKHAMGETEVPAKPQRVVTLDVGYLANALALGIQPVGSTAWYPTEHQSGLSVVEPYLGNRLQELTILGYGFGADQVSIEKLLMLQPDLIMAVSSHKAIYEQLSQIAPTVIYDYPNGDGWKDFLRSSGMALGKHQEAEALLDDYRQRIQDFRQKMGDRLSTQVSVIHPMPAGTRLMYKEFFGGSVIQDAGLSRPPEQDKAGTNSQPVSDEWIPKMGGDVIFLISFEDEESLTIAKQLQNHSLWSQLEAVQQDKIYSVNAEHWYGGDIVTANLVLDDLFKYLLEEG